MSEELYGPRTPFGRIIHEMKYRAPEETYDDYAVRYSRATADDEEHFRRLLRYTRDQIILPAGRQQLSVGRPYQTTAFNCFVGPTIPDDTAGIFGVLTLGALTMRMGGGIGWNFSTIRPTNDPVRGLGHGALASGPVSYMSVYNSMCNTIMSAGERRGAMMGVVDISHPNILAFINAKRNSTALTNFNISVMVDDEFMEALYTDKLYKLRFGDKVYGETRPIDLWAPIMESNWQHAEPGVIFKGRVNYMNPLYYCETISATNPCAEQPLPPHGCCLLGSINIAKLLTPKHSNTKPKLATVAGKLQIEYDIDLELLDDAVDALVRACDNVIDRTVYPLPEQKQEEVNKRRMGIGVTGMANALEVMGHSYGSPNYLQKQDMILERLLHRSYRTSVEMAKEKGSFPLLDADLYTRGPFISQLPEDILDGIRHYGIRNSHLTSIAPTGTISLTADNISSGIEPVFQLRGERDILTPDGKKTFVVEDYAKAFYGVDGRTAMEVSAQEHIDVLCRAQKFVDSSISKTCNVNGQIGGQGPGVTFNEFKDLYLRAWEGGAKSCTTFNINGKRAGIMRAEQPEIAEGAACFYDPLTGTKSCE